MAHILVIEDEPSLRRLAAEILEFGGHTADVAADGEDAIRRIAGRRPDVILLDVRMRGMDGRTFARVYRQGPGPHAPVVVVSADRDARALCDEMGGAACLGKPFQMQDLLDTVTRVTG